MIYLLLTQAYLSCLATTLLLPRLMLLIGTYLLAAIWMIQNHAIYAGLLYILVYVGAIVVLILFVVQLTSTGSVLTDPLMGISPWLLVIGEVLLISSAPTVDYVLNGATHGDLVILDDLDQVPNNQSLIDLAVVLFGDLSYLLVLSVLGILLAMVGPVKLAYQDYVQST